MAGEMREAGTPERIPDRPAFIEKGPAALKQERYVCIDNSCYPKILRRIGHPPERLYFRGRLPRDSAPSVAVIGARRCSSYGEDMAKRFGSGLARAGVQIISGMALGIDGIAQRAALEAGGRSFGVLGCGTDICYPRQNRELYGLLLEKGGVLSEHCAGTPPLSRHFPSRNRLISGLADIVLVIEAREKSGTLITVDFALDQGKDVYVLPGRTTDEMSRGCNRLIRQGAGIALEPGDILEALRERGRQIPPQLSGRDLKDGSTAHDVCGEAPASREKIVWEQMGERPVSVQELYGRIKLCGDGKDMELPEVTDILMDFVLRGIVSQRRGNRYERRENGDFWGVGESGNI